jgi:hypothetical protein
LMSDVVEQVIQRHPEVKNEGIPESRAAVRALAAVIRPADRVESTLQASDARLKLRDALSCSGAPRDAGSSWCFSSFQNRQSAAGAPTATFL